MVLTTAQHKGELWWCAYFAQLRDPWWIGRVSRLPTASDAMRIVNAWKILLIDGRPYYKVNDLFGGSHWVAFQNRYDNG